MLPPSSAMTLDRTARNNAIKQASQVAQSQKEAQERVTQFAAERATATADAIAATARATQVKTAAEVEIARSEYTSAAANFIPKTTYNDGSTYIGAMKDNERHGFGTYTQRDQNKKIKFVHTGLWLKDKRAGIGTHIQYHENGDIAWKYTGAWKDNALDGQGIREWMPNKTYPYTQIYKGAFRDGSTHGKGVLFQINKDQVIESIHHGMFSENIITKGLFIKNYPDGKIKWAYRGDFINDEFHKGTYYEFRNEHLKFVYHGDWKNNQKQGQGDVRFPDGRLIYKGQWEKDDMHGNGMFYEYKDGQLAKLYEGTFQTQPKKQNEGTLKTKFGTFNIKWENARWTVTPIDDPHDHKRKANDIESPLDTLILAAHSDNLLSMNSEAPLAKKHRPLTAKATLPSATMQRITAFYQEWKQERFTFKNFVDFITYNSTTKTVGDTQARRDLNKLVTHQILKQEKDKKTLMYSFNLQTQEELKYVSL